MGEHTDILPDAKPLLHYLSEEAKLRKPSPLKTLLKYTADPDNIYLASGLPRVDAFPISKLSFEARDPITGEVQEYSIGQTPDAQTPAGLNQAQQYGNGLGLPALRQFLKSHTQQLHKPKYSNWDVIPTAGNTDALYKMLPMFLSRGMPILVARWCYPTALETFSCFGLNLLSVDMDGEGLLPESLAEVVSNWNTDNSAQPCRFMYTVPCGQNPTGATMSLNRRKALYEVAQKFDLIIFEDDPYYYLQLPKYDPDNPIISQTSDSRDGLMEKFGYSTLIPSLLSLDVDGRVLRMDSWAKTVAPGLRVGWITGQQGFINKLQYLNEVSIQAPSGFSQIILAQLLVQSWGNVKLEHHIANLRQQFAVRRDQAMALLHPHLGHLLDMTPPVAGMFLWMRPKLPNQLLTHDNNTLPSVNTMESIFNSLVDDKVVLVPGSFFDTNRISNPGLTGLPGSPYLRLCYTFADSDKVLEGINRFLNALKKLSSQ